VTKGAFFHHFASKDALGQAAADHWTAVTGAMFAVADYHHLPDPLDRVFAYLDLREALLAGEVHEFTCLAGTLLQETHLTAPAIAAAANASITSHARTLEADFQQVIDRHGPPDCPFDCPPAKSLALYTQAVLQGAFILAKGSGSAAVARDSIDHLRRYLRLLFTTDTGDPTMTDASDPVHLRQGAIPCLAIEGAEKAVAFYAAAFGARALGSSAKDKAGKVMNATLEINGGLVMLKDVMPHIGPEGMAATSQGLTLQIITAEGEIWWDRAVAAGCTVTQPFRLAFQGDRYGRLRDPFGITWAINAPGAGQ
jgi:TetR/AcrR family transcriptional repressor of nem operon